MVGDSPDMRFRITGRALTALFADNYLEAVQDTGGPSQPAVQDALYWKARNWLLGPPHAELTRRNWDMRSSVNPLISRSRSADQIMRPLNPRSVACSFVVAIFQHIILRSSLIVSPSAFTFVPTRDLPWGSTSPILEQHLRRYQNKRMCLILIQFLFLTLIGIVSLSRNQGSQRLCQLRGTHWTNSHVRFNNYVSTFLDVLDQTQSISMHFEASRKWVRHQI